jgi:bifunctional DNA-binding transcriptional regulator/antitoxin component of YhaV-PrlF toxin-antitoxin module
MAPSSVQVRPSTQPTGLPLPGLERVERGDHLSFYAATVDVRGRVGVRTPLRELGWAAGTEVGFRLLDGALLALVAPGGRRVDGQGFLRIPGALRRRCSLLAGDRVLLVVDDKERALRIYSSATVGAMLRTLADQQDQRVVVDE